MTRNDFYKNLKLNAKHLFHIDPKKWVNDSNKSISVQGKLGVLSVACSHNVVITQFTPKESRTIIKLSDYNRSFPIDMVANTLDLMQQLVTKSNFN